MKLKTLLKLKSSYINSLDPTEYSFAELNFENWTEFKKVREAHVDVFDSWKEELEIKLQSLSTKAIVQKAEDGSLQAAKWVAERSWIQGTKSRKQEREETEHEEEMLKYTEDFAEDLDRCINIVNFN